MPQNAQRWQQAECKGLTLGTALLTMPILAVSCSFVTFHPMCAIDI